MSEYSQEDDSDHHARVAKLVSEGKRDDAISRELGITRHRARVLREQVMGTPAIIEAGAGPLALYETARKALAEARRVDEVLQVRDHSKWLDLYARQAKDFEMLANATELRARAERRLGEMLALAKAAGQIKTGPQKIGSSEEPISRVTLAEAGIDKKLSSRAQKSASISERAFEAAVAGMREKIVSSGARVITDPVAAVTKQSRRVERVAEMRDLAKNPLLLPEGPFAAGIADPPWEDPDAPIGQTGRHYRDHYPTMTPQEIAALMVADIFAPTAFLGLWITDHHLLIGSHLVVLNAWGFKPCSLVTWDKVTIGMGQGFTRNRTEHLVLAKRGLPAAPDAPDRVDTLLTIKRTSVHSEKPENPYGWIETWFPKMSYVELFARVLKPGETARPGWATWGNQAEAPVQTEAAE